MRKTLVTLFCLCLGLQLLHAQRDPELSLDPSKAEWFREAKFGMFIHWGLYSMLEGSYNGRTLPDKSLKNGDSWYAEWIHPRLEIPKQEYQKLKDRFNPNSVTFADAATSIPYAHIEPLFYSEYESLPVVTRKNYQCVPQEDVCYMLPDMCAESFGMNATLHITHSTLGEQDVRVTVPVGLALNAGSGKTYYIEMSADANGKVAATWATRVTPKTLKLATQNLWGKPTSVVLDYFHRIDVDVLCAQECSGLSEADIQAQGLYVHTHSNNGQGKCSIISRYPFSGITPNRYGVYIDLGEGVVVLVMNCHGAYYPYGPYQLNGIEYKGYPGTDDVDYVVKVNKEARQTMVDKLLEDFNSSTTPFVCLSGDFNEPSWLDWTEGAKQVGLAPYVVQWPTTRSLWEGCIKGDAYRTMHPDPAKHPGFTWTPRPSARDTKDRLDLTLYTLSPNTEVKSCQIIGENTETSDIVLPNWGPFEKVFDHRGLRTEFVFMK